MAVGTVFDGYEWEMVFQEVQDAAFFNMIQYLRAATKRQIC